VLPGQAANTLTAQSGFGRAVAGEVGRRVGVDVFPLIGVAGEPTLRKPGQSLRLACTDRGDPFADAGQDAARHGTLAEFRDNPRFRANPPEPPALYDRKPPGPAEWAMSIDLNNCIGCNACVVACQAENNVPVVGREQVIRQREMHWLRIDRYYSGAAADPNTVFQPMLCQHCEQAPCEVVCPVGATTHDAEGLNVMVYNRCVGTRFCSNNCPYKVRRFNYHSYARDEARAAESRNPDVSVRSRGVMEKCTFCLQRIAEARIAADRENRPIAAHEVTTACQAACPTRAITFGNTAAPGCEVVERQASPLSYGVLPEQRTRPRVSYEARIRNVAPVGT
jgi:molybdopterin-containing oxidoreductase family iron-sulfur binding subunit